MGAGGGRSEYCFCRTSVTSLSSAFVSPPSFVFGEGEEEAFTLKGSDGVRLEEVLHGGGKGRRFVCLTSRYVTLMSRSRWQNRLVGSRRQS